MTATTTDARLEHRLGTDGLLSIQLRDGDARLHAVDGETLTIRDVEGHVLSDMFAIELGEGSASLRVNRGHEIGGRSGRGPSPDLDIELPRHASVVVETASGEVEVDGLIGDQRYRTSSGDMQLRAVAGRIAIEAVSADIDVVATAEADVTVRTVSGDVELRAATLRSLQATTTSGDLKVAGQFVGPGPFSIVTVSGDALLAPSGDVRIEMATLSGDLHSELEGRPESRRGRRSLTVGTGQPLVEFRSMSGDLSVVRPTPIVAPASHATEPPIQPSAGHAIAGGAPTTATIDADPTMPVNGAIAAAYEDARLRILRSLERGEIDVAEAGLRLEALDSGPDGPGSAKEPSDG